MNLYPEVVVGIFIRNSNKELLLVKSYKWKDNIWVVPGGHIKYGESMENTLKREAKEEVGIEVERFRLIVTYEGVFPPEFHEKKHFIYLQCECFIKEGEVIKLDNNEIQEYHWFSLKEAPKQRLLPITKKTVELLIKDSNK